jgi:hypothetical protein
MKLHINANIAASLLAAPFYTQVTGFSLPLPVSNTPGTIKSTPLQRNGVNGADLTFTTSNTALRSVSDEERVASTDTSSSSNMPFIPLSDSPAEDEVSLISAMVDNSINGFRQTNGSNGQSNGQQNGHNGQNNNGIINGKNGVHKTNGQLSPQTADSNGFQYSNNAHHDSNGHVTPAAANGFKIEQVNGVQQQQTNGVNQANVNGSTAPTTPQANGSVNAFEKAVEYEVEKNIELQAQLRVEREVENQYQEMQTNMIMDTNTKDVELQVENVSNQGSGGVPLEVGKVEAAVVAPETSGTKLSPDQLRSLEKQTEDSVVNNEGFRLALEAKVEAETEKVVEGAATAVVSANIGQESTTAATENVASAKTPLTTGTASEPAKTYKPFTPLPKVDSDGDGYLNALSGTGGKAISGKGMNGYLNALDSKNTKAVTGSGVGGYLDDITKKSKKRRFKVPFLTKFLKGRAERRKERAAASRYEPTQIEIVNVADVVETESVDFEPEMEAVVEETKLEESTPDLNLEEPAPELKLEEVTSEPTPEESTPELKIEEVTSEPTLEEPSAELKLEEVTSEPTPEESTPELKLEEVTPEPTPEETTSELKLEESTSYEVTETDIPEVKLSFVLADTPAEILAESTSTEPSADSTSKVPGQSDYLSSLASDTLEQNENTIESVDSNLDKLGEEAMVAVNSEEQSDDVDVSEPDSVQVNDESPSLLTKMRGLGSILTGASPAISQYPEGNQPSKVNPKMIKISNIVTMLCFLEIKHSVMMYALPIGGFAAFVNFMNMRNKFYSVIGTFGAGMIYAASGFSQILPTVAMKKYVNLAGCVLLLIANHYSQQKSDNNEPASDSNDEEKEDK